MAVVRSDFARTYLLQSAFFVRLGGGSIGRERMLPTNHRDLGHGGPTSSNTAHTRRRATTPR